MNKRERRRPKQTRSPFIFTAIASEVLIIAILIGINGLLALSEMSIVSSRKARLQQLGDEGNSGARRALRLAESPSDFLASIQIGITMIGVLAGAFSGATVAEIIAEHVKTYPKLAEYSDAIGLGIVVVAVTLASLIFGELVPKRLALASPERIASQISGPISLLSRIARPFVRILSFLTESTVRILGVKKSNDLPVTEEEVAILIDQGTTVGVFEKEESTIMKRVLRFGDRRVGELMTQRHRVVALDITEKTADNLEKVAKAPHSAFPVHEGDSDHIMGVITAKNLFDLVLKKNTLDVDLRECILEPLMVSESVSALHLVKRFKETGLHYAVVIDEYGVTSGVITPTDLLEAIVGDLPTLADEPAAVFTRDDGTTLIDGALPIYELLEVIRISLPKDEGFADYQTVGGFVMARLGKVPKEGDAFDWDGFKFEVIDMDGHRVDKILVTKEDDTLKEQVESEDSTLN